MYSEKIKKLIPAKIEELKEHLSEKELNSKPIGERYTLAELHTAFSLIQNKSNYKKSINSTILKEDYDISAAACSFMTGSMLDIINETKDGYQVVAEGYYAAIGA